MEAETITSKQLKDKNNHTNCECGNATIYDYSWTDDNGNTSCPLCMVEWQSEQIKAMKQLVFKLSSKSEEETALEINKKYAEFMSIDFTDFDECMDFSIIV